MGEPKRWDIVLTPGVQTWLGSLPLKQRERMYNAMAQLQRGGPTLGEPFVKKIESSDLHAMKELRAKSLRLLFTFDRSRRAVMLVGGDKEGQWNKWYPKAIKQGQQVYEDHKTNTGEVTVWRGTGPVRGDPSVTPSR